MYVHIFRFNSLFFISPGKLKTVPLKTSNFPKALNFYQQSSKQYKSYYKAVDLITNAHSGIQNNNNNKLMYGDTYGSNGSFLPKMYLLLKLMARLLVSIYCIVSNLNPAALFEFCFLKILTLFYKLKSELCTCNGCNMGMRNLPDVYAKSLRAACPRDDGIHIRQIMNAHVTTVM